MNKPKFSIVLPIYKNELNLPITVPYIIEKVPILFPDFDVELIMVNDGSPDNSYEIMKMYQKKYPDIIKIASFTRNFGQVSSTNFGIKMAKGDVVGVISADLQDPFELFKDMLDYWKEGYELVIGTREKRTEKGIGKFFSKSTHFLINKLIDSKYPKGGFDFYLMDKKVAKEYISMQERNGSPQILLLWFGYKYKMLNYERKERELGKSGWSFSKKIKLFIDIFTTNTYLPLRLMSIMGVIFSVVAFIYVIYIVIITLIFSSPVPGWSSIAVLVTFFSGIILLSLGIIGEYLWRMFDYLKNRPLYVVREIIDETNTDKTSKL